EHIAGANVDLVAAVVGRIPLSARRGDAVRRHARRTGGRAVHGDEGRIRRVAVRPGDVDVVVVERIHIDGDVVGKADGERVRSRSTGVYGRRRRLGRRGRLIGDQVRPEVALHVL